MAVQASAMKNKRFLCYYYFCCSKVLLIRHNFSNCQENFVSFVYICTPPLFEHTRRVSLPSWLYTAHHGFLYLLLCNTEFRLFIVILLVIIIISSNLNTCRDFQNELVFLRKAKALPQLAVHSWGWACLSMSYISYHTCKCTYNVPEMTVSPE